MLNRDEKGNLWASKPTKTATRKANTATIPNKPIATPPPMAIPSPPLNRVNTEFQCPKTATTAGSRSMIPSTPIIAETITAKAPLATSNTRTNKADPFPTLLNTLEAPASPWAKGNAPNI